MIKNRRHKLIRDIIENDNIETQYQLTDELRKHGFSVTQATISRDIKELGLVKVAYGENSFRYSSPPGISPGNNFDRAKRMMRDNLLRLDYSENIFIIKVLPGAAQAVAFCIDSLSWKEIIGTVAGDDTILLVIKNREQIPELMEKLQAMAQ